MAACAAGAAPSGDPAPRAGEVVLSQGFESPEDLSGWQGSLSLGEGREGGRALYFERTDPNPQGALIARRALPAERLRGCLIHVSALVKMEGVSEKPRSWNGVKLMVPLDSPAGKLWPQAPLGTGSAGWAKASVSTRVPVDAASAELVLGLEGVTGKAWFDDLRVVVGRPPARAPSAAARARGPLQRRTQLRGAMVHSNITPESLRVLGQEWKANLIRWQLTRPARPGETFSLDQYDAWLEGELRKLDAALPHCERYGLRVVLDLHSPPGGGGTQGGYAGSDGGLFTDAACQSKLLEVWRRMARRYRDAKAVWAYDLVNEPVDDVVAEGLDDWQALAERVARAVRAIDPKKPIIVEPSGWGSPEALARLQPIDVPGVIYSVHMYVPHAFTHQGVHGPTPGYVYPGVIEGERWDRARLELALKPVVDFQRKHRVPIYIGEFSAIRWAPDGSAYRYLKDVIDIFESHGWDWTYHAFREWDGWSVEHGPDRDDHSPASTPTDRERLLRSWYARNRNPDGG